VQRDDVEDQRHDEEHCRRSHHPEIARRDGDIDHAACQERPHQLQGAVDEQKHECAEHEPAVRPDVAQQAPHQPGVVRLAQRLLVVN